MDVLQRVVDAIVAIANAPSEMTWGEDNEVRQIMEKMEAEADSILPALRAMMEKINE